jgi:hypothetical protein
LSTLTALSTAVRSSRLRAVVSLNELTILVDVRLRRLSPGRSSVALRPATSNAPGTVKKTIAE